jgi:hypothetical protein
MNTIHKVGTYKYHMERAKYWDKKSQERKNPKVALQDLVMANYHLELAHKNIDN